jgi:hypothetical protein
MSLNTDDLKRCNMYISRPDMTNIPGLIEWIEALLNHIDDLTRSSRKQTGTKND